MYSHCIKQLILFNSSTQDGKTALSIAQRLGYISVVETLKIVTETTITTTTTTVTEEKYKVVVPETMHETFMSESEDEGGRCFIDRVRIQVHVNHYILVWKFCKQIYFGFFFSHWNSFWT